jgi:hypothetical protein
MKNHSWLFFYENTNIRLKETQYKVASEGTTSKEIGHSRMEEVFFSYIG